MRTFEENLSNYHTLRALNRAKGAEFERRLAGATTKEEKDTIFAEFLAHSVKQKKLYSELGKEMVVILGKSK